MELVREPRPYWHDTEQFAEFARWMDEERQVPWWRVVAKPWHFEAEYREYDRELEMDRIAEEHAVAEDEAWRDMERRSAL